MTQSSVRGGSAPSPERVINRLMRRSTDRAPGQIPDRQGNQMLRLDRGS